MIIKFIPNILTLLNLFIGCIVVLLLVQNGAEEYILVKDIFVLTIVCIILDFMDGFLARKLNVKSELGIQLDSLADLVSFGLVPAIITYNMFVKADSSSVGSLYASIIPFMAFIITLCSAFRLARFNIRKSNSDYYLGLATPANAVLVFSVSIISSNNNYFSEFLINYKFLIPFTLFSSFILISNFKLINFKFKSFEFPGNRGRIFLILSSTLLLFLLKINAIPIIFLLYFLISLIKFYLYRH